MTYYFWKKVGRCAVLAFIMFLITGCAARQVQDSLVGSTAQKLVTYSVDDLAAALPEQHFDRWSGKRMRLDSNFLSHPEVQTYADRRIAVELARRFDIEVVDDAVFADATLNIFYTSLGTNRDTKGFFLPLGFIPGMAADMRINILTLEQFQGIAELYYFVGETGTETRGRVIQARTRSDAVGLPIVTIPINNIDRVD